MSGELRLTFVFGTLISCLTMKVVAILQARHWTFRQFLIFSIVPILSFRSWQNSQRVTVIRIRAIATRVLLFLAVLMGVYAAFWKVVTALHGPKIFVSYLAVFPVLMLGTTFGPILQLLYAVTGRIIPEHHNAPLLSRNLQEFWGSRWNTWFSDWCRHILFQPLRERPWFAAFVVFLFSGLWHELIINVPAKYLYGLNEIGTMFIYFLLQFFGVLIDRLFLNGGHSFVRRVLAWVFVVGPVPLILNEPVLRIAALWPAE